VDVRSTPYSRFHPQYNKTALAYALQAHTIDYTWAGEALGGRPKDPSCYKHHSIPSNPRDYLHEISYPEVMQRPWFVEGIQQLLELAVQQVTCIMCAEKDPAHCHRASDCYLLNGAAPRSNHLAYLGGWQPDQRYLHAQPD
jgi:uncharacterized protein (DUF488 family)